MSFSMAPLLMHDTDLPAAIREQLRAAYLGEPERRDDHLVTAARLMHQELALECSDARELVGLPASYAC